jgi:Protein of unknown function (DUF4231)
MGARAAKAPLLDEGGAAPAPTGPVWERLEDQLGWYDRKSGDARRWYQSLKVVQIVVAAAIPVAAAAGASRTVPAALGATVVVIEGIQQLFQFHQNWIRYRTAAESLKREKYLYLAKAGQYATADSPDALLAETVERISSKEGASWSEGRRGHAEQGQKE